MKLSIPEKPWFLLLSFLSLLFTAFLITTYLRPATLFDLCSTASSTPLSTQLSYTLLHYVTTSTVPQQSNSEIRISLSVLLRRRPCNFLVFGLGHDSPMWHAFNPTGTTLFLEEDPKWVHTVLRDNPHLRALTVKYPTQLSQADELLRQYKSEPTCLPGKAFVKGNKGCRLALGDLDKEVYEKEWDVIMLDAPRGYAGDLPGRMGVIWTAAVMARKRKGDGWTDVFLHDVDRRVEREFALEFLCKKYLVESVQRLWHFRIPPARDRNGTDAGGGEDRFC